MYIRKIAILLDRPNRSYYVLSRLSYLNIYGNSDFSSQDTHESGRCFLDASPYTHAPWRQLFRTVFMAKLLYFQPMIQVWIPYARHYNPRLVYFLPTFRKPKTFFQGGFVRKFCPYVWLVFKSGFWSRAGYSGACTVFRNEVYLCTRDLT